MKGKLSYPKKEEILNLLKAGFVISAAFIAPGSIKGFKNLFSHWQKYDKSILKRNLKELKEQKLVTIEEKNGKEIIKISEDGKKYLKKVELDNLVIKKQKRWDGKWRVVIFDIPEDLRKAREYFRSELERLGLVAVQESVYIYPYPCFTEINIYRELYNIKDYVRFMVVKEIEREEELREEFRV